MRKGWATIVHGGLAKLDQRYVSAGLAARGLCMPTLDYDQLPRVPISRFRRDMTGWMRRFQRQDQGPIVLTRRGSDVVVAMPAWLYEKLSGSTAKSVKP